VVQVRNRCGNNYLSKGMAKGSDPGVALPQQPKYWLCKAGPLPNLAFPNSLVASKWIGRRVCYAI
jgi:hypothetical protein